MEGGSKNVVRGGEKELKMEESKNDDSKENKPLNKVPVDISKTKEKDFEENDDLHLQLSSDSDEELKDLKEEHKKFSCPKCLKHFKGKYVLKKHILHVHEKRKDYICETCKKTFAESGLLKRHILHLNSKGLIFVSTKGVHKCFI